MKGGIAGFILLCILGLAQVHSRTVNDALIHGGDSEQVEPVPETLRRVYEADFDQRAEEWIRDLQNDTGQEIEWHDMYLKHQHLQETQKYSKYHINAYFDNFRWGKTSANSAIPAFNYTKWYHNGGSQPVTSIFSETMETIDQFTWSVSSTVSIQVSAYLTVGLPEILMVAHLNASSKFEMSSTTSHSQATKQKHSVENTLSIPPKSSVKVEFVISKRELKMVYKADIFIEGYIAVWFKEKWKGHWLWFFPIARLQNDEFRWSPCRGLMFGYRGVFHGIRGVDHYLHVSEYPYQEHMLRTNSTVPVGEPINVYQIRPPIPTPMSKFAPKSG